MQHEALLHIRGKEQRHEGNRLGPLLCWAVVFADVGTSIYYVPGILYGNVGKLAGFFVMLTMSVFVLLTLKYAEVTHRFPQGGGVVTVAAQAINHWVGALGGMFILVDYFLTAAISCLSGMLYLSVVVPAFVPFTLELAIGILLLLGLLNWFGVAISASALLIFAGNTAIIGSYHVFLALSRMEFFPQFVQQRNMLRGTPHFSILLAIAIPICVLIVVHGVLTTLGDLYAFGLLGAFTLTCVSLDIVRRRERQAARAERISSQSPFGSLLKSGDSATTNPTLQGTTPSAQTPVSFDEGTDTGTLPAGGVVPSPYTGRMVLDLWHTCKFYLGLLTTVLVVLAWTTNLVAKPMATIFGGSVTLLGMGIASFTYSRKKHQGYVPVPITHVEEHLPGSILAVLLADNRHNEAVIRAAIENANGKLVTFLYLGHAKAYQAPRLFEFHDPYYDDQQARSTFGKAEHLAQKAKIVRRFVYRQLEPDAIAHIWQVVHPRDLIISSENASLLEEINPDRIRYEMTADGRIAHLLKS